MSQPAIWLLFGLPVTEMEFCLRLSASDASARSDYLARFDDPGLDPKARHIHHRQGWRREYADSAGLPLQSLVDRARACGCEVRQAATLADVRQAAERAGAIILFSHWKGAAFSNDDFLPSLEGEMRERLANIDHPLANWLRNATTPQPGWLGLRRKQPMAPREALRRCLGAAIRTALPPGVTASYERPLTTASRRRDSLDHWLAGCIRPGNRLELFDGLHDKNALSDALEGFAGILDLTACTSTYLGDHLGHAAKQRFRTVQFLELQDPIEAAPRLGAVLALAAGDADAYMAARQLVAREFAALVEAELKYRGVKAP